MSDLFDMDRALTPAERKKLRRDPEPKGHAWTPGTGPHGETCKTCAHIERLQYAKVYLKCGKNRANWTSGRRTDIRAGDPACKFWEKVT